MHGETTKVWDLTWGFASLQVTEQIGDAPYQGPLLFRPPNKRRKWQGLEEKPRGMGRGHGEKDSYSESNLDVTCHEFILVFTVY